MWGKRRDGVVSILAVAFAATMLCVPAGGAAEERQGSGWLVDTNGHPVEPYAQIPKEVHAGSPFSWVQLEGSAPERCEGYSAIYNPSVVADALVSVISEGKYGNPTRSRAINPATSTPSKGEWATFPNGPKTTAECPTTTSGMAEATLGRYRDESLSLESASSDSTMAKAAGQDVISSETTNKLQGIRIGELSIGSILSWLKVEFPASAEPKISYRVEISGVTDGKGFNGASADGVVLSGQGVAGRDLIEQFNEQVRSQDQSAFETLARYGLRVLEPRVGISNANRFVFELSALDGLIQPAARRDELGHGFGVRLGTSRAAGRYEFNGRPAPHDGYDYIEDPDWALT